MVSRSVVFSLFCGLFFSFVSIANAEISINFDELGADDIPTTQYAPDVVFSYTFSAEDVLNRTTVHSLSTRAWGDYGDATSGFRLFFPLPYVVEDLSAHTESGFVQLSFGTAYFISAF